MAIWRMREVCCVPKATNVHSEYVIVIAFRLQQWLHERAPVLRSTYMACLVELCSYTRAVNVRLNLKTLSTINVSTKERCFLLFNPP
jgi:hypothetical protein